MNPKRWNVLKAAALGIVPGAIYSVYSGYAKGEFAEGSASGPAGFIIGGALACAALFALVAAVRNRMVRAR